MTVRPEERAAAQSYNRLARGHDARAAGGRLLRGTAGAYLTNTPFLKAAAAIQLSPKHRVLDLGCGHGHLAAELARRYGLIHPPVGVDISAEMIRGGAHDLGPDREVELAIAAASRLPFADQSFHLVVAAHLFRHLEDETLFRVLVEALRVLKPRGILLGWEFAPTSSRRLNSLHRRLFAPHEGGAFNLRGFGMLAPYALYAGFHHVDRLRLPLPFLFPPVPRVAVMLQKSDDPDAVVLDEDCATRMWESRDRAGYDRQAG